MIRAPESDFWQAGIAPLPIQAFLEALPASGALQRKIVWLPDPGSWRYLADPMGVWRGGALHVFVEAYDYRTKHGVIERYEFGRDLALRGRATALTAPCHLSYPFLVEDGGEVFMVPESYQAREIALYRAENFPDGWIREKALLDNVPGSDASLIRHGGRWWMFFAIVGPGARDQRELHAAWADALTGPWRLHPQNPLIDDRRGARPGGTPFVGPDGAVILPVQDCSGSYGGALRFVRLARLEPESIVVETLAPRWTGGVLSPVYPDGFHTLASCGDVTLVDAKRVVRSWARHWVNLRRRLRRAGRRKRAG